MQSMMNGTTGSKGKPIKNKLPPRIMLLNSGEQLRQQCEHPTPGKRRSISADDLVRRQIVFRKERLRLRATRVQMKQAISLVEEIGDDLAQEWGDDRVQFQVIVLAVMLIQGFFLRHSHCIKSQI